MKYSLFLVLLHISIVLSQELQWNSLIDSNQSKIDWINEPFSNVSNFRRESRILNYGNKSNKRNFLPINKNFQVYGVESISDIADLVPTGKPIILLLHEDNLKTNRDVYINMLINASIMKHDIRLMKFNSSGVTSVLESTNNDMVNFKELVLLNNSTTNCLGCLNGKMEKGGVVFFSILKAMAPLPEDSAVIVFTSGEIEDEDFAKLVLKEIEKKNIKIFLVWESEYPTKDQKETVIAEIIDFSGGAIFIPNKKQNQKLYSIENSLENATMSLILNRMNLYNQNTLHFPIDSGTTSFEIILPKKFIKCQLITPDEDILNLPLKSNISRFMNSYIYADEMKNSNEKSYRITSPRTGVWTININGLTNQRYNVKVLVQNDLFVNTEIVNFFPTIDKNRFKKTSNVLKVDLHGFYKKIESIAFLNEDGEEFYDAGSLKLKETGINANGSAKELNIDIETVPNNTMYVKTTGKDSNGNPFVRLSYVNRDPFNKRLQPITIEVGEGSELFAIPNQAANIYFKVTNNRYQQVYLQFHCRSNRRILRSMSVYRTWINPRQTITVVINTFLIEQEGVNYRDEIVFQANGYYRTEKIAYLTVSDSIPNDLIKPQIWYTFSKSCTILSKCEEEDWSIEVTAQDAETGLRELSSSPTGLYFPNGYASGTKEPITGYYTGSCCQSKMQLIAYDLKNNRRYYDVDAYNAPLGPGAIAAIVLSIIIVLAIIIGLIIFCKFRKKESDSYDLPTYRAPSRRHD